MEFAKGMSFKLRLPALAMLLLSMASGVVGAKEISGSAFVREDGSLRIGHRVVQLHGIFIPSTSRACRTFERPVRCAPRAALALDFKIRGFVHCEDRGRRPDGSRSAVCWTGRTRFSEGEDLAAYLLRKGWAAALPDAPFEYHVLERIARGRGLGIWGFPLGDSF